MAANVARAENNFKIAQFNYQIQVKESDAHYYLVVLNNRNKTIMDGIIIFLGLFVFHFAPAMQPYMEEG